MHNKNTAKRDVLGTTMLSMLFRHKRYAHIAGTLRGDGVLPELLSMSKIVSEDAVRRALKAIDEDEGAVWLRRHLDSLMAPLLAEPWILDIDTTVKPLYGHQEGGGCRLQPEEARATEPLLSHLFDGRRAAGVRCRCMRWQRALVQALRARPVDVARSHPAGINGPCCCAATRALATTRSCAKRNQRGVASCSSCG